jgi:hypothetical protein
MSKNKYFLPFTFSFSSATKEMFPTIETSFEFLTQEKCNLLSNNINSLCRESLNNKSPFEAMKFMCDDKLLNKLNLFYIEPDKVQLNDKLLK